MNTRQRIKNALKKNWMRQEQQQWVYGKLGRLNPGSLTTDYEVKGRKNFLYVTVRNADGSQAAVPARNDAGVPYTEQIQVKIKQEYGVYVIGGRTGKADEGSSPSLPPSGVLAHAFTEHTDVPNNYTGDSLKVVRVNVGETALEFATLSGAVDSVNGFTGVVVLDADDIDDTATTNKFTTAAEITKLSGIEALADVTDAGNVGAAIVAATTDDSVLDADLFPRTTAGALVHTAGTNIKAWLKTYFDTLYATAANITTAINNLLASNNTWTGTNDFERNVSVLPTNTTGNAFAVQRNLDSANTNAPMVALVQDNASDDQAALVVQQDGTGDILILYDGATEVFSVDGDGRTVITQTAVTGVGLSVSRDLASGSTDSPLVTLVQDNAGDDQIALRVQQDGTGAIITGYDGATKVFELSDGGTLSVYTVIKALSASGVKFQDSGGNDALFIENGGQVGVKTLTPLGNLHGYAVNFTDTVLMERGGQTTDGTFSSMRLMATKTTNMGDGFGPMFAFIIQDDAAVLNSIAFMGGIRDGGDTTGAITLQLAIAGVVTEKVRIDQNGIGLGTNIVPEGALHVDDGVGSMLFVSKTGIVGSAVPIVSGVTIGQVHGVLTNNGGGATQISMTSVGPSSSFDIVTTGGTLRFSCSAGGALTVARQAGTATWAISINVIWK
jgi:hypothetical protein